MIEVRVPPRGSDVWKTPMFEQYWRIRETLPEEIILFYRMGDFFEIFGSDAIRAAPLLEVQLTARSKDAPIPVPMCGVPVHALDSYSEKLLAAGHRIAICDQIKPIEADVGATKLIERKIVRILTPGLPVEPARLDGRSPHWLVTLGLANEFASGVQKKSKAGPFGVVVYDFLAAKLFTGEVLSFKELSEALSRLDPKEIVYSTAFDELGTDFQQLKLQFAKRITPWARGNASQILEGYLKFTQRLEGSMLEKLLPEPAPLSLLLGSGGGDFAKLSESVLHGWNVFPEGFDLLDDCGSVLGSRKLRQILTSPLKNPERILRRQNFFRSLESRVFDLLLDTKNVYDIERLLGRFRLSLARPREFLQLASSLGHVVSAVCETRRVCEGSFLSLLVDEGLGEFESALQSVKKLLGYLDSRIAEPADPSEANTPEKILKFGFDPEFDRLRALAENASDWILDFESHLRESTGISSLKVRYNKIFGFFIEVTKTHLNKVPEYFERKQTTVGGERFVCEELKQKEQEILTSQGECERRASQILLEIQSEVLGVEKNLATLLEIFSWVDASCGVISALSKQKRFGPWIFPETQTGNFHFDISDLRHPLIQAQGLTDYIPNSLKLGIASKRLLLLTGPNMAGKSTLMRSVGLGLLFAQCGFKVPAASFVFSPTSGFFSRMGAADNILRGESTFMVEMKETAQILKEAGPDSFVLFDEVGRGTSTQDGLAIAGALLEFLASKTQCVGVFATHYHELSQTHSHFSSLLNGSMAIREWKGELVFLRKLVFEPAESSYGIYVARLAGLPKSLVQRAEKLLEKSQNPKPVDLWSLTDNLTPPQVTESEIEDSSSASMGMGTLSFEQRLIQEMRTLNTDEISPKMAHDLLCAWVNEINGGDQKDSASLLGSPPVSPLI